MFQARPLGRGTGADPEPIGGTTVYSLRMSGEVVKKLESVARQKVVWSALLNLVPPRPDPGYVGKWMDERGNLTSNRINDVNE